MDRSEDIQIQLVRRGLLARSPRPELLKRLVEIGVSEESVERTLSSIERGLRSGVQFAVTKGVSKAGKTRGECLLYDAAFDEGIRSFRREARIALLKRLGIPIAFAVGAIITLLWLLLKPR